MDFSYQVIYVFQYQHAQSAAEYEMKWRHWRDECIRRYHAGQFAAYPELETIVQVIASLLVYTHSLQFVCK